MTDGFTDFRPAEYQGGGPGHSSPGAFTGLQRTRAMKGGASRPQPVLHGGLRRFRFRIDKGAGKCLLAN